MLGRITLVLLFILLIWGNLVAGLGAGLACPDWPLCYGQFIPPFRWDILMEKTHRVLGGITAIFLIVFAYRIFRAYAGKAKLVPVITVLLLLFQIVLGGIVVLTKLHVDLTTFHFANAIVIFMLTLYMVYFDGLSNKPMFNVSGYKGLFFALSVLVLIQLVLGAYVRHTGAGLACPDFPTCLGYIVPPRLSGLILNHFSHRTLAYLITALAAVLLVMSFYSQGLGKDRGRLYLLVGLIVIQIALGATVVLTKLHFAAAGFHLVVALLILWVPFNIWCRRMKESSV